MNEQRCINNTKSPVHNNPVPTVDIVVINEAKQVVLIKRKNPPFGWAIPGGFIDYGETVEHAAVREAKEETCLDVTLQALLGVYSDPARDPRLHTISTVFIATSCDYSTLQGADDALQAKWFYFDALPTDIAFDHRKILADAKQYLDAETSKK